MVTLKFTGDKLVQVMLIVETHFLGVVTVNAPVMDQMPLVLQTLAPQVISVIYLILQDANLVLQIIFVNLALRQILFGVVHLARNAPQLLAALQGKSVTLQELPAAIAQQEQLVAAQRVNKQMALAAAQPVQQQEQTPAQLVTLAARLIGEVALAKLVIQPQEQVPSAPQANNVMVVIIVSTARLAPNAPALLVNWLMARAAVNHPL